jgi:hypothetical protein
MKLLTVAMAAEGLVTCAAPALADDVHGPPHDDNLLAAPKTP